MAQELCFQVLQEQRKAIVQLYRFQMMSIIRLVVEDIDIVESFDELLIDSTLPYNGIIKGHIRAAKNKFPHVPKFGKWEFCSFCGEKIEQTGE